METILITYIIITIVCMIGATIAVCSPFIPMVVERKSWKVWKQCYNDENFIKTFECEQGVRYDWADTDYYAIVFKENNECKAAIFRKHVNEAPVFCTYFEYHAKKLAKKLMASNK